MPKINIKKENELSKAGIADREFADHSGNIQQGYQLGSLTEGLVAYYPMEEGQGQVVHDAALNNLGQINAGEWTSGQVGSSSLHGASGNNAFSVPDSGSLDIENKVTISAWINPDVQLQNMSGGYPSIVQKPTGDSSSAYTLLNGADGTNDLTMRIADGSTIYDATFTFSSTNWTHICGTYNGEEIKIYSNGTEQDSTSVSVEINTNDDNIVVGSDFEGYIDDLRIYDRALSQPEVEALYNLTSPSGYRITENEVPTKEYDRYGDRVGGAVARYKFNGDVKDYWGDNNGADNTSAGYVDGVYGQSKDFDGSDDKVELPDLSFNSSTSFTVSTWTKRNSDTDSSLFGRYDSTNYDIIELRLLDSGFNREAQFRVGHVTENDIRARGGFISDNQWYHVLGVYDSSASEVRLYINGRLTATGSGAVDDFSTTTGPWIGARNDGSLHTDGHIDDVRIYSRALSPVEVEKLYNKGAYRIRRGGL